VLYIEIMKTQKIKQTDISEWLGIHNSLLSEIKKSGKYFTREQALRLSDITGLPLIDLLFDNGEKLIKKLKVAYAVSREAE